MTPLMCAIQNKIKDIVNYLREKLDMLDMTVDINSQNKDGETPLILAIQSGNKNTVKYLIERKPDINLSLTDYNELTYLHYACKYGLEDLVKYLIEEKSMDINSQDKYGMALLMYAIGSKNENVAKYLIERKSDIDIKDENRWSCLHYACKYRLEDLVKYLIEEKSMDINSQDKYGMTLLMYVIQRKDQNMIKYLIERKPDIDIIDNDGWSYLHYACKYGFEDLVKYLIVNNILKQNSSFIDAYTHQRFTPFRLAIDNNNENIVKLLINHDKNRIDVNLQDIDGCTPLHYVMMAGYENMAIYLKNKGAKINIKNRKGETPLLLALHYRYAKVINNFMFYSFINPFYIFFFEIRKKIIQK
ncbi:ankyrin [Piromyces finnis]|uniref:Ankyrin n=1 Tax=Piromyces finnis TaxID=1754191 RepID=A0A1Y1VE11_9FUNG|nr:ankyrin [Piromyces finnis]|eukprot:ORX53769.1 ankyrin [Piromyces finnis]